MSEIFIDCENIMGEYLTIVGLHSYGKDTITQQKSKSEENDTILK
jgi:hypothetical protein